MIEQCTARCSALLNRASLQVSQQVPEAAPDVRFGKDVYMWKTYFKVAGIGDTVQFQIHVSDKGSPQVQLRTLERHLLHFAV